MIVGVDASNIRTGGGLTYFSQLLHAAEPGRNGIEKIAVWAKASTLEQLPRFPWLDLHHVPLLDRSLPYRLFWQKWLFPKLAQGCDLVFVPGSNAPYRLRPMVTVSHNMLPFESKELFRYGFSLMTLRLLLLRWGQGRTFRRADGVIFLSRYARDSISKSVSVAGVATIIPHGIQDVFRMPPRPVRPLDACSEDAPLRLLYVSIVDLYKHQQSVAEAVATLRGKGLPVVVDFVGPAYGPALKRLRAKFRELDPEGSFLHYRGPVPHVELRHWYRDADLFIFASSCENLPNIMIEAMSAGLPIASSNHPPMPEVLGDAGVYFDPRDAEEIAEVVEGLLREAPTRDRLARLAYEESARYSWKRCAEETLEFIAERWREHRRDGEQPGSWWSAS